MSDSGFFALVVRMLLSLGTVLLVIGVAFLVARRRVNGSSTPRRTAAARGGTGRSARRSAPPAIEVVGRAGLSKGSMAVALRFGDSVVLVGVSEAAPTSVLTEMDASRWDELHADQEYRVPVAPNGAGVATNGTAGPLGDSIIGARPSFMEALREATTRRG